MIYDPRIEIHRRASPPPPPSPHPPPPGGEVTPRHAGAEPSIWTFSSQTSAFGRGGVTDDRPRPPPLDLAHTTHTSARTHPLTGDTDATSGGGVDVNNPPNVNKGGGSYPVVVLPSRACSSPLLRRRGPSSLLVDQSAARRRFCCVLLGRSSWICPGSDVFGSGVGGGVWHTP